MPAIALEAQMSTGHGCFPPTNATGPYTTKSFISGKKVQLRGVTMYAPHVCGIVVHPSDSRKVVDPGGSTFFLEGKPVAFIGDPIACGDMVGEGAPSTFSK